MIKKHAVIFATNYENSDHALQGCINDGLYWQQLAIQKKYDTVTTYFNDQCTKEAMVQALNDGLAACQPDDLFLDCYSGHGTIGINGQMIVPNNFSWNDTKSWLTYSDLDQIFLPHELRGVKIAVVHDSCQSFADPLLNWRYFTNHPPKNRFIDPPQYIKDRTIGDPCERSVLTSPKGVVLLSGSQKNQFSADYYEQTDGKYHGAFSYYLSVAFTKDSSMSYFDTVLKARALLADNGFDQICGIAGDDLFKLRPFFE
jgi:hypothetical protein